MQSAPIELPNTSAQWPGLVIIAARLGSPATDAGALGACPKSNKSILYTNQDETYKFVRV